jgi:tRNA(Ile)-lysidine synthase
MPTTQSPRLLGQIVGRALARVRGPIVLAVSGGVDSMLLLHLAARSRGVRQRCTVATFDHNSGPHSSKAARLVRSTARALGIDVVSGRARATGRSEAEWREMRWSFLRSVAARRGATIVTAHTRDDQVETVVMRLLRGASARGLAGLYATSPIVRPLLGVSRRAIEHCAQAHAIARVDDPTNSSRAFLRNRVRHDLLPAIRAVRPSFERDILDLSKRAARLRRETERLARGYVVASDTHGVEVSALALDGLTPESLALLWPAFVSHVGVPLDRRAVARATDFSLRSRPGQQAQCGGGITLERTAETIRVRRAVASAPATVELGSAVEFGMWRFRRVSERAFRTHVAKSGSSWAAAVEQPAHLVVRAWQPGDRVWASGLRSPRRVKRYFSERAIPIGERKSWPVVCGENGVVWVPGIVEPVAANEKLGSALTYVVCERRAG